MRNDRLSRIKLIFIIAAIVLLSLSVFSYIRIVNLMQSATWVNETATVKLELEVYFSNIKDLESANRGYLLSKNEMYVAEFDRAIKQTDRNVETLRKLTANIYSQRINLKELESLATTRISNLRSMMALGDYAKIDQNNLISYRENRNALRKQIDKMLNEEDFMLTIREKSLVRKSAFTPFFASLLMICCILVLIATYYTIYHELKTSNRLRDDLEEKNKSLVKMNAELESFTYISSHDLQEPLRKIQTFISRVLDLDSKTLTETTLRSLTRAQESANRMQNLVRDLLAYSRISAEVFPLQQTNLSAMLDEIKNELDEEIIAKKVSIKLVGVPELTIISSQFRQLLINLISNSIKFSHPNMPSKITISNETVKGDTIGTADATPDKMYSKVTISDNGIGFDAQYKDRIFKVFQRLHIEQEFAGTGIGLAIVKKIVDNHHGFITAESEIGKGAQFILWIPK